MSESLLEKRDIAVESQFLNGIKHLNYVLLQRDWSSESHGDLDIVIDREDWPPLVEAILKFSKDNSIPVVKVYEIEKAAICIILLMENSCIHLDVCIAPHIKKIYGVNLQQVIQHRELSDGVYILDEESAEKYKNVKKKFKRNRMAKIIKKIKNISVIVRRLRKNTLFVNGGVLYIPFLIDSDILRSVKVIDSVRLYLVDEILPKYS